MFLFEKLFDNIQKQKIGISWSRLKKNIGTTVLSFNFCEEDLQWRNSWNLKLFERNFT